MMGDEYLHIGKNLYTLYDSGGGICRTVQYADIEWYIPTTEVDNIRYFETKSVCEKPITDMLKFDRKRAMSDDGNWNTYLYTFLLEALRFDVAFSLSEQD